METFIIYFAKASCLLVLFYLAYMLLLKKETFFTANRFFLLSGLFTSALLPLAVYTKTVWVTPPPAPAMQIPVKVISLDNVTLAPQVIVPETFTVNWFYVAAIAYAVGFLFFAVHFLLALYKVKRMLAYKQVTQHGNLKYIDSESVQSPFSFFNYIVYNSAVLQPQELDNIIAHEKVHSSQKHSLDVLVCQLFCIVFWFNPFAWLYKKAISQNLEFIADSVAAKQVIDVKAYQITLLKITMQPGRIAITNHFYQSLIKKRIVMLNKQQSKRLNFYKYALIVPALIAFILLYQVEVVAQEKEPRGKPATATSTRTTKNSKWQIIQDITKDTKDEELKLIPLLFKKEFDADVIFSNIKRNAKGEITSIKVIAKDKDNKTSYPNYEIKSTDDSGILPFTIDIQQDEKTGKNIINFGQVKSRLIKIPVPGGVSDTIEYGKDATAQIIIKSSNEKYVYGPEEEANYLYIIDGIPKKEGENSLKDVDPTTIDKVEVLKDKDNLVKLYGDRAKNGVIIITTKKKTTNGTFKKPENNVSDNWYEAAPDAVDIKISEKAGKTNKGAVKEVTTIVTSSSTSVTYNANDKEGSLKGILENDLTDYKKAYIRINGKEATADDLEKINPKKIVTHVVIPPDKRMIELYGAKAANGAILIEMKGFKSQIHTATTTPSENATVNAELEANTSYIINRRTDKTAIKFYTRELAKKGLELKINTIERNKDGIITSIEVKLVDKRTGKIQLASYANSKGIADIYVGLKGGAPELYSKGK